MKIRDFQGLLRYICEDGFEHHVAVNPADIADRVKEAPGRFPGWQMYLHE